MSTKELRNDKLIFLERRFGVRTKRNQGVASEPHKKLFHNVNNPPMRGGDTVGGERDKLRMANYAFFASLEAIIFFLLPFLEAESPGSEKNSGGLTGKACHD